MHDVKSSRTETSDVQARRTGEILGAAEVCFVRSGFHRTTIQSIADEAAMSVGNVYRYFPSKDAVVEALIVRDHAMMAADFDRLATDDLMGGFAALMRRQILECGHAQAVLWLEICAESARNPVIAAVTQAHHRAIAGHLQTFFARVAAERARTGKSLSNDPATLAQLVMTLFSGLMVTQALAGELIAMNARIDHLLAIVGAAVEGHPTLAAAPDTTPHHSLPHGLFA